MPTPSLFTGQPDGAYGYTERLEWLTDVRIGRDGTEQRTQVRALPRYRYEWTVSAEAGSENYAALAALRAYDSVLVPLWPHGALTGMPTRGISPFDETGSHCVLRADRTLYHSVSGVRPEDAYLICTAREGVLEQSRAISHVTDGFATYRVAFRLLPYVEYIVQPVWPTDEFGIVFPYGHDWSTTIEEAIDLDTNLFDTDTTWVEEVRHGKRSLSIQIMATTYADVTLLRKFLFVLKGRLNAISWTPQVDEAPSAWRMASDAVEIQYITPSVAQTKITLVQL